LRGGPKNGLLSICRQVREGLLLPSRKPAKGVFQHKKGLFQAEPPESVPPLPSVFSK
jgi:hypothetical protein